VQGKKVAASKIRKEALHIDANKIKDWIRCSIDKMIDI